MSMRLGVLDIGSNTGHLLVVDAHGGAAPLPASSHKQPLRLAEHLDEDGAVTRQGIEALTDFCASATRIAEDKGCAEMLGFATSAVRDAVNSDAVLDHVEQHAGVRLEVLSGEDEARLTFLAVRRWFGWSAGRLAVFDIGGGSLEIAAGTDEAPDVAWSLPLGAARMARMWFGGGRPGDAEIRDLRKQIRADIAHDAGHLLRGGVRGEHPGKMRRQRHAGLATAAAAIPHRVERGHGACEPIEQLVRVSRAEQRVLARHRRKEPRVGHAPLLRLLDCASKFRGVPHRGRALRCESLQCHGHADHDQEQRVFPAAILVAEHPAVARVRPERARQDRYECQRDPAGGDIG